MRYFLFILIISLTIASKQKGNVPTYTIQEALKKNLITYTALSNGNFKDTSIILTINKSNSTNFKILVNAGTVFIPSQSNQQKLLVLTDQTLSINSKKSIFYIKGFCFELNNKAPTKNSIFLIDFTNNENLISLCNFFKANPTSDSHLLQEATWCISSDLPISNIVHKDTSYQNKTRKAISQITKKPIDWYASPTSVYVDPLTREIVRKTIEIKGEITFTSASSGKIIQQLEDSTGKVIATLGNGIESKPGQITYEFYVKVLGWKKGHYFVVIKQNNTLLLKKEFMVSNAA